MLHDVDPLTVGLAVNCSKSHTTEYDKEYEVEPDFRTCREPLAS